MVTSSDIKLIANKVKENFVKNKTYPKSVSVNNKTYTIQEATYLMASFTAKPGNVDKIKVGGASSPSGDRVNRKVIKSVYQDMSKRLVQYIKQNGKLPNYVTIDGKQKCSIILFMLQLSKIVSAYNGKLPDSVLINSQDLVKTTTTSTSSSSSKKYGHATKQGCDNMGQNTPYYCGCHSLQEVFRNLTGVVIPQSTIASIAGTTTAGTDHDGLNTVVAWFNKKYGFNLKVQWKNLSDIGWNKVKTIINSSNQDIVFHNLYRNQWGHYEVMNSISGSETLVQNSLGSQGCGSCYCGYVESRSTGTFQAYINGISQKSLMIITRG